MGLSIEDGVWNRSVFRKNREWLIEHDAVTWMFNVTHDSATDAQVRPYGKCQAAPALPSYLSRVQTDNQHGLVVNVQASQSDGYAERETAVRTLADVASRVKRITVSTDKVYETRSFVQACHKAGVTPHVARGGGCVIDGGATRHASCAISKRKRKRVERCFEWGKQVGALRQLAVRGLKKVGQLLMLTIAAYNLARLCSLAKLRPQHA